MLRAAVLALTVLSGFTGLAYEVTWQKYLAVLLGAHSEATAAVLGLFLGGLSLGYWLLGLLTRRLVERGRETGRPPALLAVYGAIEAGIGVWCLLFPWLFPVVRSASVWLPTGAGAFGFAVDVVLAAVLIVPPATLMGGTIPILTQALARDLGDATRVHAQIYACNTAGAFAGTLATGFVLIHWLGLEGTLYAMGMTNLAIGGAFAWLGRRRRDLALLGGGEAAPLRSELFAVYGSIALLVGFAMMVLQTVSIRVGGLAFGASEYTFTMVVAVFVLCIALGSFAVSALPGIGRAVLPAALWCLGLLFTGLYFWLETSPYWAHRVRIAYRDIDAAFYPYYFAVFTWVLVSIGPAVLFSGAVLPLLFHALRREVGDLGSQAGRLYSVNTLGSLLGALIGGYALLYWLDLHHVYRIALCAIALAAALATLHQLPQLRFAGAAVLLLGALYAVDSLPAWRTRYLAAGTFRQRQPQDWSFRGSQALSGRYDPGHYSFYDDDPNSSVAVIDFGEADKLTRSLLVNGKSDGNTNADYSTMSMLALLPALFAERAENAFVIGFGTGTSTGELAHLPETKSITVAEISSGVIAAAPLFDFANHGVSKDAKVHIVHSDAYRALQKGERDYDVIVSEPSNPWVSGVEMLYSKEFLSEARDRLTPGGVFSQWFHVYETSPQAVELVLATYAQVFEHVSVWSVNHADIVLLGFRNGATALDLARLEARMQQPEFRDALARIEITDLPKLLVHETLPLGVAQAAAFDTPVHSLYHPRLSFEAGRGFFVGMPSSLPFTGHGKAAEIGAQNSLLLRYLARYSGAIPESVWDEVAFRACNQRLPGCGALAAAWSLVPPNGDRFSRVAAIVREDSGAMYLPRLRRLIARVPADSPEAQRRVRPPVALEMTRLYTESYAHAVPFDPEALLDLWRRCGGNPALCQRGASAAERLLSSDAPFDPAEWMEPSSAEQPAAHVAPVPKGGESAEEVP
jgi:spermidine synthase